MIKHIVMFRLKENANGKSAYENALDAKQRASDFEKLIPSIKHIEIGINSPEAPENNYNFALVCDFESIDKLKEYQNHPVHLKFAEFIHSVREERACIDYEY